MKYLLNRRSFISLMVLFSFFDNFGMEKDYDYLFKVLFVGDTSVGKTQIINKFVNNSFKEDYKTTTSASCVLKSVEYNGEKIKLELWDSPGQEKYKSITENFYKGSQLIVLVYAIDDKNSFDNIQNWVNDIKTQKQNAKFLLVGNKCDLEEERQVSREEAEKYAKDNGMKFFEVSAKEGTNINDDMFNSIIQDLLDNMEAEEKKEKIQVKNPNKDNDDMFDSIIQNLFDDMETEEKKKENNNHTYNIYNDNKQGKLSFNGQNKDIIEINKNSCWSEYCPCCPCLGKTEKDNEEQKEIENDE